MARDGKIYRQTERQAEAERGKKTGRDRQRKTDTDALPEIYK